MSGDSNGQDHHANRLVLPEMRRSHLAEMIRGGGEVRLLEAARHLGVSEMTVRRDLEVLQMQGVAKRVHGGAVAIFPTTFAGRAERATDAKIAIAAKLELLVPEQGAIAFDASSTVAVLAGKLPDNGRRGFFTNGIETFLALARQQAANVHLLGGRYERQTGNLVGPLTTRALEALYFDVAIVSCAALDPRFGATEATLDDAETKGKMLEASKRKILAVDHTKLGVRGSVRLAELEAFDLLVTELDPDHKDLADYRAAIQIM
ncbi:MAG: DeoR/GlpR family DNA-binding transcription regulator [Chloroflexota bacterium]